MQELMSSTETLDELLLSEEFHRTSSIGEGIGLGIVAAGDFFFQYGPPMFIEPSQEQGFGAIQEQIGYWFAGAVVCGIGIMAVGTGTGYLIKELRRSEQPHIIEEGNDIFYEDLTGLTNNPRKIDDPQEHIVHPIDKPTDINSLLKEPEEQIGYVLLNGVYVKEYLPKGLSPSLTFQYHDRTIVPIVGQHFPWYKIKEKLKGSPEDQAFCILAKPKYRFKKEYHMELELMTPALDKAA